MGALSRHLSKKLKVMGRDKFNSLNYILALAYLPDASFYKWVQYVEYIITWRLNYRVRASNIMLNHHLPQMSKLKRKGKFHRL